MYAVSVIIPALNEERYIANCLACLTAQTIPLDQFEVILIDNGSTDRTRDVAESFQSKISLTILTRIGGTIAGLRNEAARHAHGEIFAFLDADCYVAPDWLEAGIRLADKAKGVWGAHYRLTGDSTWISRIWVAYQAHEVEGDCSFIPSSNLFIHASDFRDLNGFNVRVPTSEDVELCTRAHARGMSVTAYPILAVLHAKSPRTLMEFYRKNRWHGISVLPNFIRNLPSLRNSGVVIAAVYTLVVFWLFLASIVLAIWARIWWPVLITFLLLVIPPPLIALRRARAASLRERFQLTMLYMTYLLARAAAILRFWQALRTVDVDGAND